MGCRLVCLYGSTRVGGSEGRSVWVDACMSGDVDMC